MDSGENIDGIILSIHVKNFFCHENLYIDFRVKNNKNVHSIMGDNGSGKSTILTALVIGLGGRAADTFRGNNLQSFIKRGKTTASIEIKIKNSGTQAYRHDTFGDSITIVRTINTSGGSYKILSASGVLVSTKASDIKAIAMAHDIQVENPISVLNQDDARSFHSVNAEEKYAAFRRATNFAQTEEFYNKAQENCKKADVILARKNEAFLELSKEHKRLKSTHDQMKSQEEIENEKRQLQIELKWFEIEELEREVINVTEKCEKLRSHHRELELELRAREEEYANSTETLEALRAGAAGAAGPGGRRAALERALRGAEAAARGAEERARAARDGGEHSRVRLRRERGQTADLLEAIRSMESGGDDAGSRREALRRAEEEARVAVEETAARRDTARHEEEQAREHAARAAAEAERGAAALRAREEQLGLARRELLELRQRAADSLAVFGAPMVRLVELVERAAREGRFSAPPRGPVGNFLKVRNKEWASALEHIIGNSINYFCVNTDADSKLLMEIMGQVYRKGSKPGITCCSFSGAVHDVSARRAGAAGATCALDALEVKDPVVANFLIDNLELETVLLVADHEDAARLSDSVENVPANCSKVVTRDCSDYMPAPLFRTYGGLERPPRFLGTSTSDRSRQMEANIVELEKSVAESSSSAAHLSRQAEAGRRAQARAAAALHALQSALRERERVAEDAAEALQQHSAPRLAALKEKYESRKGIVSKLEEEIRVLSDEEQSHEEEKKRAHERVDEVKRELDSVKEEYRNLQEEKDRRELNLERCAAEKAKYERRVAEEAAGLRREEEALRARTTALATEKEGLGPRPSLRRPPEELRARLRQLGRAAGGAGAGGGGAGGAGPSRRELRERLDDVTERRRRVHEELRAIEDLVRKIVELSEKHLKRCVDVQTNIGRHVALKFTNILRLRNYLGHINLDHADGKLELYIDNRSASSLSGGERSYSTVALFMAMWECVEVPFYFMDEFDVFMDGVNRTTVWQLLVDFASERNGRQFVFLTQRALPLKHGATVVHRLSDPRN